MNEMWIRNIENISINNEVGECPFCCSNDTNYCDVEVNNGYGYEIIWCNNCKNACHISRIKITAQSHTNINIPKDLKF